MDTIKITLDAEEIQFPAHTSMLEYLRLNELHIPATCKVHDLDPYGACRLCTIEVNGRLMAACTYFPRDGDAVVTRGDRVADMRRTGLELML